jgi:hypothetical protein
MKMTLPSRFFKACAAALAAGVIFVPAVAAAQNPVRSLLDAAKITTEPAASQDFVRETPSQSDEFLPTNRQDFSRPIKVKSPDELKAAEDQLEALRQKQQARVGGGSAPPAKEAKQKKKPQP